MTLDPDTARAWVDIDLVAVVSNARRIAQIAGTRLLPMVKANAYGLGAVQVARALEAADPWGVGVSTVEEGAALRHAGYARPIVLVTPLDPEWIDGLLAHRMRPVIGDLSALDAWTARTTEPFHVDIDTGMSRSGIRWDDSAGLAALRARLADAPAWEGASTHFHSADADAAATQRQWERFQAVLATLPRRPALVHAANSAAALRGHRYAGDLIRPGIFLYGGGAAGTAMPEPVVAFRARVVAVRVVPAGETVSYNATWRADRPTTIATITAGYADGIPRAAVERGAPERPLRMVELGGEVVPIVGRVTMDMCMVATPHPVAVGDVATLYGGLVSLDDHAKAAGTISYELLTAIGGRVPRRYGGVVIFPAGSRKP